jgi:hypothetical protein
MKWKQSKKDQQLIKYIIFVASSTNGVGKTGSIPIEE